MYNIVFKNKKRPDFIIKNFKDKKKYSFIIENKLRYSDLVDAKKQAYEYADFLCKKELLTKYFLLIITDLNSFYVSKCKYEDKIVYLEDIPYIDTIEDLTKDFFRTNSAIEDKKLMSLENQRNLKETFDKINNKLREYGLSSDQKLHLTMAVLFLKLIKEKIDLFGKTEYKKELQDNLNNLDTNLTETNIKNVFNTIAKIFEHKFSFSISEYLGKDILIELWTIVKELNLDSYDLDVKGEAFEYFINYGNIKSDIGEYFTPRHIVRFMVKCLNEVMKDRWLINNKGEFITYIDPTCGTGGFLISIFKQLRKEVEDDEKLLEKIKTKSVYGVELSKRTSEIAKMNLILAGDGHTNILNDNFLNYKSYIKKFYDISIGNMPFGKKINEPEFVNGFLDIIKDGSYSIFIVPSGIIGTTSKNDYIAIREKLLVKGKIIKLISLPQGVFAPYTHSKTYVIFWKKEPPKEDYSIEFFEVLNDGFTLNDRRDTIKGDSDLDLYFKDKTSLIKKKQIFYVNLSEIFDFQKINEILIRLASINQEAIEKDDKIKKLSSQLKEIDNKIQKKEKIERIRELSKELRLLNKEAKEINEYKKNLDFLLKFSLFKNKSKDKQGDSVKTLEQIADIVRGPFGSSIKKSVCVEKGKDTYKIYEQGNVINEDFNLRNYYLTKNQYEKLKRFKVETDDILMTCAGTLGKVALVPKQHEDGIFNSVLMRFRCNKNLVRPKFLKLILETDEIQDALVKDAIGVGIKNMVPTKEIKRIKVFIPSLKEQDKIIEEVEKMNEKIYSHNKEILVIREKQKKYLNHLD